MSKITMTVEDLEGMLRNQKHVTAEYITRNLSTYTHFRDGMQGVDIDKLKSEMQNECRKSPFPNDFVILKKYLPNEQ